MKTNNVRKTVREGYAKIAKQDRSCGCAGGEPSRESLPCCGGSNQVASTISRRIGYSEAELNAVPQGSNLGLGCGNPTALASLQEGETVLDLGSGAGFDCFLAASRVGHEGKVIGVDMTPEMLDRARENARQGKYRNVEFRLGEIENLPVADSSVDVIISNCVINLSDSKPKVFQEAFRVLKPAGRLMVSDIVLLKQLPHKIKDSIAAYVGCLSGAISKAEYLKAIEQAGFRDVKMVTETSFPLDCIVSDPTARALVNELELTPAEIADAAGSVASIQVSAVK